MTTQVAVYDEHQVAEQPISPFSGIQSFENAQRMAKALSSSDLVPLAFRGNMGNTLLALELHVRLDMPVFSILQNIHVIHGKPGFSATFMTAVINASGRFDGPLRFEYNEDKTACTAYSFIKGERIDGQTVTMEMAKREGWLSKKGSKWQTMPQLMLSYRAATFFARMYASDMLLGLHSTEELVDSGSRAAEPGAESSSNLDELNAKFAGDQVDKETGEIIDVVPESKLDQETTHELPENLRNALKRKKQERETEKKQEPDQETKATRSRPAQVKKFCEEVDQIETSEKLDTWRSKNNKRVKINLPREGDQDAVFSYAEQRYQQLAGQEIEPGSSKAGSEAEQPGDFVSCPQGNGNVPVEYCNDECNSRKSCPKSKNIEEETK